ncbi:MAG: TraB/GumN family protein [Arenimonas sp.]|nr:TraB/GumN family protein [Arenimonas sp.]
MTMLPRTPWPLAGLLAAVVLACACGTAQAQPPTPLLWKVSDADSSLYLLGSFHLLKPGDYPLAPAAYAALEDAEQVLFELAPDELNDPALARQMASAALLRDGSTLQQALPPETWAQLVAFAQAREVPIANLQPFEPWYASLVVALTELSAAGLDAGLGLDRHMAERAASAGKPVFGLETGAQQIAVFDGMAPALQLQALQDTLAERGSLESEVDQLHALWRAGDAEGLFEQTGAEMKRDYPALFERVNVDRNQAWLPRLQAALDRSQGDDTLVVVGALHLLGDEGLVAQLKARGYTVERL